jgi:competence protein ComEC
MESTRGKTVPAKTLARPFLVAAILLLALAQQAAAELRVHFIDTGQGDAILLEAPEAAVMVDAGWDNGEALAYLRALGIDRIDIVVGSHAHADHIGGFTEILPEIPVDAVWYNGQTHTTQTFERFVDAVIESGAAYHEPSRGERVEFGELDIVVLHPTGSAADYDGHLHDHNIVLKARYGDVSFMLTGDAETEVEHEMIAAGLDLGATVLKLGHHGSRTSTSPEFVAAVTPEVAVYQAGEDNRYGHPHPDPLEILTGKGIEVFGNDVQGTIVMATDGHQLDVAVEHNADIRITPPSRTDAQAEPTAPEGRTDEAEAVYGRADHRGAAGAGGGREGGRPVPQARDLGGDVLQLEGQVRRHGRVGGEAAEGARGRERQAEEASGRADAGCGGAARAAVKKMVGPAVQARSRRASAGRDGPVGAAGLHHRRRRSHHDPLPVAAASRAGAAREAARSRQPSGGASAIGGCSSCCGGRESLRHQPHLSALPGRRADGAQAPGASPAVGTRAPILVEARANARWSLDFVHDQFACGRRFRVLNIVDDVTRECLAAIPDTSISGRRVARELTDLIAGAASQA